MKRKLVALICLLATVVILANIFGGNKCTNPSEIYLKKDLLSDVGKLSAYAGGKIYYFSQEQGTAGIYSMHSDGNEVQFLTDCKGIGKIQVKDNWLYFTEYQGETRGEHIKKKDEISQFRLKRFNLDSKVKEEIDIYPENIAGLKPDSVFRSIWDFYVLTDGNILIANTDFTIPQNTFGYNLYMIDMTKKTVVDGSCINDIGEISAIGYNVYEYKDELIFTLDLKNMILKNKYLEKGKEWIADIYSEISIFNKEKNETFNTLDNKFNKTKTYLKIHEIINNQLVLSQRERLLLADPVSGTIVLDERLPKYGFIKWTKKLDDNLWIVEGNISSSNRKRGEVIYYMDLNDYSIHFFKKLNNLEIAYFDERKIIAIGKKSVQCYGIGEGVQLSTEWKVSLEKNLTEENIFIEVCDKTLFIVERDREKVADKLLYKINVDSGKVLNLGA